MFDKAAKARPIVTLGGHWVAETGNKSNDVTAVISVSNQILRVEPQFTIHVNIFFSSKKLICISASHAIEDALQPSRSCRCNTVCEVLS